MDVRIVPVPLGIETGYLLQGDSCLFIDGGPPGQLRSFLKGLERASVKPGHIRGHSDGGGQIR